MIWKIMKRNISADDQDPYSEMYFKSGKVIVEFYKDRQFRSIFEVAVNTYHIGWIFILFLKSCLGLGNTPRENFILFIILWYIWRDIRSMGMKKNSIWISLKSMRLGIIQVILKFFACVNRGLIIFKLIHIWIEIFFWKKSYQASESDL